MNHPVELVLNCCTWQEAQRLADALLEKNLVSSVETFEVKTRHWWDGPDHRVQQVNLIVLGQAENTEKIQIQADKLHSVTASTH